MGEECPNLTEALFVLVDQWAAEQYSCSCAEQGRYSDCGGWLGQSGMMGVQVAGRTNDAAGDGTTTASVLARELIHYGLQVRPCLPTKTVNLTTDVIPPGKSIVRI